MKSYIVWLISLSFEYWIKLCSNFLCETRVFLKGIMLRILYRFHVVVLPVNWSSDIFNEIIAM